MADKHEHHEAGGGGSGGAGDGYDSELNVRAILYFAGGVLAFALVVVAVMGWMSSAFKRSEEAKDLPPSPLAEARLDPIPPGPRLQPSPPRDMDELRAQDRRILTTYGWVDRAGGIARIPVDRAIEILAEKGLGAIAPPPAESVVPPASSPPPSTAPTTKAVAPKKGSK